MYNVGTKKDILELREEYRATCSPVERAYTIASFDLAIEMANIFINDLRDPEKITLPFYPLNSEMAKILNNSDNLKELNLVFNELGCDIQLKKETMGFKMIYVKSTPSNHKTRFEKYSKSFGSTYDDLVRECLRERKPQEDVDRALDLVLMYQVKDLTSKHFETKLPKLSELGKLMRCDTIKNYVFEECRKAGWQVEERAFAFILLP